jgi:surfeit locus 1 family protein
MPKRTPKSLAIIFLVVAAVCARLGTWQLSRLHQRRAANTTALAKRVLPVVALDQQPRAPDSALVERRVVAIGRYDYERELVIRGQALQGVPGIHIVTPLLLQGGDAAVLVNRGFVPTPDAVTAPPLDPLRERGTVRVEGIALPIGTAEGGRPLQHNGRTTWGRLDLEALRRHFPYPIAGIYVRRITADSGGATADVAAFPIALALPAVDDGPHLSYALQWFAFAALALIFAGIVWRRGA